MLNHHLDKPIGAPCVVSFELDEVIVLGKDFQSLLVVWPMNTGTIFLVPSC